MATIPVVQMYNTLGHPITERLLVRSAGMGRRAHVPDFLSKGTLPKEMVIVFFVMQTDATFLCDDEPSSEEVS